MDLKYGIKLCITAFSNNEVTIDLGKSNFSGVVEAESWVWGRIEREELYVACIGAFSVRGADGLR